MKNLSHPQVEIRRKPSVCFHDTLVKKHYGSFKTTSVLQLPAGQSDSSSTLSSIWGNDVDIMDLELEDPPEYYSQANGKKKKEEKRAPIVHFTCNQSEEDPTPSNRGCSNLISIQTRSESVQRRSYTPQNKVNSHPKCDRSSSVTKSAVNVKLQGVSEKMVRYNFQLN